MGIFLFVTTGNRVPGRVAQAALHRLRHPRRLALALAEGGQRHQPDDPLDSAMARHGGGDGYAVNTETRWRTFTAPEDGSDFTVVTNYERHFYWDRVCTLNPTTTRARGYDVEPVQKTFSFPREE